jgi:hypothetical protein
MSLNPVNIVCGRCHKSVRDAAKSEDFTAGYYEVSKGNWNKYARKGEENICDACMWADPEYIKDFGKVIENAAQ